MNILLVEDDPKTALFVTEVLQKRVHKVRWAATGTAGLSQARNGETQLVIIDRMLPQMDGLFRSTPRVRAHLEHDQP